MKRPPKETTQTGEAKAAHMLKRLKDRPRKQVPLADFYRTHEPAPPLHTADPSLPTSTAMNSQRTYQMQPERRYEPSAVSRVRPVEDRTKPNPDWVAAPLEPPIAFGLPQPDKNPLKVTQEVLRAFANDLRTTEPQVAEWADYLAGRIGG